MKELELIPVEDLDEYIFTLWQTKEFQIAHKNKNSYLRSVLDKFMSLPRMFFTPHDKIEKGHFTTWFNCIEKRTYDNPYIQDLYYFHEMSHLAHMTYKQLGFYSWYEKMQENELMASLMSEVFIYYFMEKEGTPIRQKTFPFEIWYDSWEELFTNTKGVTHDNYFEKFFEIVAKRKAISFGFFASKPTLVEKKIARYSHQNFAWAKVWKLTYLEVERMMQNFVQLFDGTKDSVKALKFLEQELCSHEKKDIFFYQEAVDFHKIYLTNDKKYGAYTVKPVEPTLFDQGVVL